MEISNDVYSLTLLRDGMYITEILRDSSLAYLEKLRNYGLIVIDPYNKVYLTDKGRVAKKMGLKKFIELEKLEKDLEKNNPTSNSLFNRWLFYLTCFLQLILTVLLVYLIFE